MNEGHDGAHTRREFLRGVIRLAALAGLGALSGAALRRKAPARPGDACVNRGICAGCVAFERCGLPQALSSKKAGRVP